MPEVSETGSQAGQNWIPQLDATQVASISALLQQVSDAMPFLIGLTPEQRLRLARVGDRTRPFVQDALSVTFANPGLLPRSVNLDELRARAESLTQLNEVKRLLQSLLEKVSDSEARLASDLYGVTRTVYTVLKTPATVPGLIEQRARLRKRFQRKTRRSDETPAATEVV